MKVEVDLRSSIEIIQEEIKQIKRAIEKLSSACCPCSVNEKISGHRSGCYAPEIKEIINEIPF